MADALTKVQRDFREAVECVCDDVPLPRTQIGSILIDLGHRYIGDYSSVSPHVPNQGDVDG